MNDDLLIFMANVLLRKLEADQQVRAAFLHSLDSKWWRTKGWRADRRRWAQEFDRGQCNIDTLKTLLREHKIGEIHHG